MLLNGPQHRHARCVRALDQLCDRFDDRLRGFHIYAGDTERAFRVTEGILHVDYQ
jgi:hypothetical protein